MSKTILITGGAGYIGSVLTNQLLCEGYKVHVLDSLIFGEGGLLHFLGNPNFKFLKGDIRDTDKLSSAVSKVDTVIHLAAIVGDPLCSRIPDKAFQINQSATFNLVDQCKRQGVQKFIFSSTCSNYGIIEEGKYADERSIVNPISLYAKTKVESENYILKMSDGSFSSTILRLATVYGLSQRMRFDLLLHELLIDAVTKKKISLYGASYWRPLIHVRDVANAISLILKTPDEKIRGEIFNVGNSAENYTKHQLAELISNSVTSTEIEIQEGKKDPRNYRVSFDKIANTIGYRTQKTVKDGINEIVHAINENILDPRDPRYSNLSFNVDRIPVHNS